MMLALVHFILVHLAIGLLIFLVISGIVSAPANPTNAIATTNTNTNTTAAAAPVIKMKLSFR